MSKKTQTRKAPSSSIAKTSREKAHSAASAIEKKPIESEFAQSGDFFRSLVENSQVCACLKDEAGRYVYASKAFGRYFPQLIGKTDADLFSAATARELRDHDLAAFMSSGIAKFDETTEGVGGVLHWTSLKFSVVSASGQKLLAVICLDVTKQKNLEEQLREGEERYRTLAEITSDYAFTLKVEPDRKLTMEWSTPSFSRISGLTQEEVVDREGWRRLPHPDDLSTVQHHHEAALSGQEQTCEFRIIAKSGEVRWLRESMRPVWDR